MIIISCSPPHLSYDCSETGGGYLQALDSSGSPRCLCCQKPSVVQSGWAGGFCSTSCMEELQLRSHRNYAKSRVLETERGVCQTCGVDARQLYLRVRDAPHAQRKEILDNTWLAQLPLKMVMKWCYHINTKFKLHKQTHHSNPSVVFIQQVLSPIALSV